MVDIGISGVEPSDLAVTSIKQRPVFVQGSNILLECESDHQCCGNMLGIILHNAQ